MDKDCQSTAKQRNDGRTELHMTSMEKRLFYLFIHRDQVIRLSLAISATIVAFILQLGIIWLESHFDLTIGDMTFTFSACIGLTLIGIFGLVPGMCYFAANLIYVFIHSPNSAYMLSISLMAMAIFYRAVKRKRLLNQWHCAGITAGITFILGNLWQFFNNIIYEMGFKDLTPAEQLEDFLCELPEVIIAVLIVRIILLRIPEGMRRYIFMADYYSADPEVWSRAHLQRKPSVIEKKITALIVGEAIVLGITAAVTANILIPDVAESVIEESDNSRRDIRDLMRDMMSDPVSGTGTNTSSDVNSDTATDDVSDASTDDTYTVSYSDSSDISNIKNKDGASGKRLTEDQKSEIDEVRNNTKRFVLNRVGLAFDLKLIMMILNVAIPFVVLTVYFAKQGIGIPIARMARSLRKFCDSEGHEKDKALYDIHALDIVTNDEIGMLYSTIDQMAENVVDYIDTVKHEQQLKEDLLVAQRSAEAKTIFLSSMSHEIRTPINAVLGLDEMIIRESSESDIRGYAIDIKSAGRTLLSLINDVLDSSKLEAGRMDIIPVDYELSSVINDLVNMVQTKADDKGLELSININEEIPHMLNGDEIRVKQVILNILTNAVKYTEKGTVTLTMSYEKKDEETIGLFVSVKDTGIGIKEEDFERLYTPFQRLEEQRNRNVEGTGLGMNIVKQLLALMDSQLDVKSVYGEGSEFSFTVEQKVVNWEPIGDFAESYERARAAMEKYQESFIAPDAKILIVDDTPLNLTVAKGLIKETQVQIDTADSGDETLDKVRCSQYDVIFLDHMMPGMDGIQTLKAMKELKGNMNIGVPVIALTANALSGARSTYIEAGFDDYLSKPIDGKKFEAMLMRYLPEEKVLPPLSLSEKQKRAENDKSDIGQNEGEKSLAFLHEMTGIDYDTAITNCGSEEILLAVLKDYLEAVPSKSADIERFELEKDYENYGILVHALKSSSRLIGATALSEHAMALEEASYKAVEGDKEAAAKIHKETPELLKSYRMYFNKITPVIFSQQDDDARPLLKKDELFEAMGAVREFASAFDFDSADMVMAQIRDYRVPEEYEEHYNAVSSALSSVDQALLLEKIDALLAMA